MIIGGSIRLNPCGLLVLGLMSLFILYYTFGSSVKVEEKISMKTLLSAAIDVAKKGGDQVRRIREQVILKCLTYIRGSGFAKKLNAMASHDLFVATLSGRIPAKFKRARTKRTTAHGHASFTT